jgi:alkyl hydroperoxide reductase subunit AhpC
MKLEPQLLAVTENFKTQIPAEVFDTLVAATEALMRSDTFKAALKPGDMLPSFALPDANGQTVSSRELLARGQLLLTFYRGDWCPYCNLALKALHDQLPVFRAADTGLVAVSPQTPDHSITTRERLELDYPVLSDVGNVLARQLGIVFSLSNELRPLYTKFGIDLNSYNGDDSFELPLPATFLIGSDGMILERFLEIDYRKRIEPETAVSWVRTHAAH